MDFLMEYSQIGWQRDVQIQKDIGENVTKGLLTIDKIKKCT